MEVYLLIFFTIFLAYWYWKRIRSSKNLPPGPIGIPILGYVPSMNKKQHITFSNLKSKYGDIFCFYIGQQLFVVLSSYTVVKEAFIKHGYNFAARPAPVSQILPESPNLKGIALNTGKLFTEYKQMALSGIKSFTRSTGAAESIIMNEVQYLFDEIDKNGGNLMDIRELLSYSTLNIIWQWLFGERNNLNDKKIKATLDLGQKIADSFQTAGIEFAFPQLLNIPFVRKIFQASTTADSYRCLLKYFDDKINEIESQPITEKEYTFVREWLKLYPKGSDRYNFHRKQLSAVLKDLFLAGMETSAYTLQWAILYMMEYPEVQQKATIMEVQRITSILPLTVPHLNSKPAIINGYTIPKDSVVLANIWEILHDPKTFPNPHEFRPDRFLENGELKRVEELIPFSIGKRQCIGKSLARTELFLFFTSLLQRYTFKKPDGVKLDLTYDFSFVVKPRKYEVIITPN